ncbi:MAG: transcription antitermination factor NusB [Candidatus Omnitrophota bacterium]
MRQRTLARECALKIIYWLDIGRCGLDEAWDGFWQCYEAGLDKPSREFSKILVCGVSENLKDIDAKIEGLAANWDIGRMAVVERNILRMAAFEILFLPDIPRKVSINEAIDLAKKYGDRDSGKFVNGILDKINTEDALRLRPSVNSGLCSGQKR